MRKNRVVSNIWDVMKIILLKWCIYILPLSCIWIVHECSWRLFFYSWFSFSTFPTKFSVYDMYLILISPCVKTWFNIMKWESPLLLFFNSYFNLFVRYLHLSKTLPCTFHVFFTLDYPESPCITFLSVPQNINAFIHILIQMLNICIQFKKTLIQKVKCVFHRKWALKPLYE